MTDKINKLVFIFKFLEALNYFKNEDVDDHVKRNVLRYFFVLLDDLLKMIGNVKNELFRQNKINLPERRGLERSINKLRSEFDSNYDIIRDKFGAHHQEVSLFDIIDWWNEVDLSTISILFDDACEIKEKLVLAIGNVFDTIEDYSALDFSNAKFVRSSKEGFYLSHDRLAQTKKNTVGLMSIHDSQDKAQIITSIVDLTFDNCAITVITDNSDTDYKTSINIVVWLLIICDCCSLLDNLYEDINNNYVNSKSLLQIWKENKMKGYPILSEGKSNRDEEFENDIREVRNKIGAHLDQVLTLEEICALYNKIDISKVHKYFFKHANIFRQGCLADIRTKMFALLDSKLENVIDIAYSAHKGFED